MIVNLACLGVVLAGGASKRMGKDKASLPFAHGDMLSYSKSLLQRAGINDIVVSGNQHQVPDLFPGQGPVSGIMSVIEYYRPQAIIVLPVDMPLLTNDALTHLIKAGQLKQQATFYRGHPLPLYLPINAFTEMALAQLKQQMSANSRQEKVAKGPSIRALLSNMPQQELAINDKRILLNTNTPEQWRTAQQEFNKRNKHE